MRWDGDSRGRGVADASAYAEGVTELLDSMQRADWVAEEPEVHLLHHLRDACERLPLELVGTELGADGIFEVELVWTGDADRPAEREAVFALAGSIAESASYIRARGAGNGTSTYELVTGFLADDTHFAVHGHAVRFRVRSA